MVHINWMYQNARSTDVKRTACFAFHEPTAWNIIVMAVNFLAGIARFAKFTNLSYIRKSHRFPTIAANLIISS